MYLSNLHAWLAKHTSMSRHMIGKPQIRCKVAVTNLLKFGRTKGGLQFDGSMKACHVCNDDPWHTAAECKNDHKMEPEAVLVLCRHGGC